MLDKHYQVFEVVSSSFTLSRRIPEMRDRCHGWSGRFSRSSRGSRARPGRFSGNLGKSPGPVDKFCQNRNRPRTARLRFYLNRKRSVFFNFGFWQNRNRPRATRLRF